MGRARGLLSDPAENDPGMHETVHERAGKDQIVSRLMRILKKKATYENLQVPSRVLLRPDAKLSAVQEEFDRLMRNWLGRATQSPIAGAGGWSRHAAAHQ